MKNPLEIAREHKALSAAAISFILVTSGCSKGSQETSSVAVAPAAATSAPNPSKETIPPATKEVIESDYSVLCEPDTFRASVHVSETEKAIRAVLDDAPIMAHNRPGITEGLLSDAIRAGYSHMYAVTYSDAPSQYYTSWGEKLNEGSYEITDPDQQVFEGQEIRIGFDDCPKPDN
jgi:hypothetical protein